ncbi:bifunctional diguanylate cyclase/phosphodiesterase [Devosia sp.]|uniref:putative bifunctional diguanylate cyclase/phosphodiesterase n=1 Tax=Devosia sp. TaxID=1871048 RepID=UPI001AD36F20|nr:bifunctional diguanylate cyclase/phosphodiesterase [Devosia sp.]MBN9308802.1 bifunctional diguanylate cyclase/phosphodiesterase [Devosia sp.]
MSTRIKSRRTLSMLVMATLLVVFACTALIFGGFLLWSAGQIDADALQRQTLSIRHAVEAQLGTVPRQQQSVAIRDDTVIAARDHDTARLATDIGKWMFSYFGHDESYVLSSDDAPAYAAIAGRTQPPAAFEKRRNVLQPFIGALRSAASAGYVDEPPYIADYLQIDSRPAIISVTPIISDSGNVGQPAGREAVLVSVVYLDAEFGRRMIDHTMTGIGRFSTGRATTPGEATFPVQSRSGRIVGFFEWQPYRPGSDLLQRTGAAAGLTLVIFALLVLVLMHRLRRALDALEHKRRDAERQASEDPLTGLPNRLSFDREFEARLGSLKLRDAPLALLMLDLDRFKQVNDTLGHNAGDELIRSVADRLRQIVEPGDILARLGGDEFAILHYCYSGSVEVSAVASRIVDAIARPFRVLGSDAFVGVSIGIVIAGAADHDSRELSRKADIALYEAKSGGRNRAAIYEEEMDELVQGRHTIEAELREALRVPGQLWVAFQPLCSQTGSTIVGAEALVRWIHPRLGNIAPARFIGIAESTGLIEPLGEFVLRRAAQFGARWPGRTVAVNISPAQLRNPGFAERVFDILAETGMAPADLEMEITESILLEHEAMALDAIRSFREAGVRIALDDFGTGYSSLNYLKRYPVDRIKIDRSFVSQLGTGEGSEPIVQAMVTLAHALGIEVTAEGVETQEQFRILAAMGCNTFQGFLFSAPLTVGDMATLLTDAAQAVAEVA